LEVVDDWLSSVQFMAMSPHRQSKHYEHAVDTYSPTNVEIRKEAYTLVNLEPTTIANGKFYPISERCRHSIRLPHRGSCGMEQMCPLCEIETLAADKWLNHRVVEILNASTQ
jgi:hypothetical protein